MARNTSVAAAVALSSGAEVLPGPVGDLSSVQPTADNTADRARTEWYDRMISSFGRWLVSTPCSYERSQLFLMQSSGSQGGRRMGHTGPPTRGDPQNRSPHCGSLGRFGLATVGRMDPG